MYEFGTQHFTDVTDDVKRSGTRVFVDGKLLGYFKDGKKLVETLRGLRRTNSGIHPHVEFPIIQQTRKDPQKELH